MRSTIIPAQITTVEDKIAGNLNLTQIFLLLCAVLATALVYCVLPPSHQVSVVKSGITATLFIIFGGLALRIKGKVILTWLGVILTYNLRPRWYVFNKNDSFLRTLDIPAPLKTAKKVPSQVKAINRQKTRGKQLISIDQFHLEQILQTNRFSTRFSFKENGNFNVALEEIK